MFLELGKSGRFIDELWHSKKEVERIHQEEDEPMLEMSRIMKNNWLMKSLTGLSIKKYMILSEDFEKILFEQLASKLRKKKLVGVAKET